MKTLNDKYKYNPFLKYGKKLENIISKKNYDNDIANMLRLAFPVMIEYYGHEYEDILFNTLNDIIIDTPKEWENMYDIVQRNQPSNLEMRSTISAVKDDQLKRASGVHSLIPNLEIINGKISLTGKSEVVSIMNDTSKLDTLATFVHEFSHAIKSHENNINLLEDKKGNQILVIRSGISVRYNNVFVENGKIVVEDFQEKNIGLEEGINTYDENNIINKILSIPANEVPNSCKELRNSLILPNSKSSYASSGYYQEALCADKLLNDCKLNQVVRADQFFGTNNCEKVYNSLSSVDKNTWKNLNSRIDLSVKHTYDRYKNAFNPIWFENHKDKIIDNLNEIHAMLDNSSKNENILEKT